MSKTYGDLIHKVIQANLERLAWQCAGCCYVPECEAEAPRGFSRYCENIIEAAIFEKQEFEQPEQEEMNDD
jgi:hypothetical protein